VSQKLFYFVQLGEKLFFCLKVGRVHTAAAAPKSYRMLEVEHLVIHDVFDGETGNPGMIEDAAHHDGIVRGIIVAEAIA
jgi:hypothetical protein